MKLAEILSRHLPAFNQCYGSRCTPSMHQAINAILQCRTGQNGHSQWQCAHCDHREVHPLSCGHRSCPQCQHQTTCDWLAKQQAKLLPVDYFMATFTLPSQLRHMAWDHQKLVYQGMFMVAAGILKDFALTSPRLGAEIGCIGILHTHNRRRDFHPHVHFVVTGGGYDRKKRQWCKNKGKYLFNAFALAKVWRARLLDYLVNIAELKLPDSLPPKWVVDCRRVGRGLPALRYLSRYLYRGVLPAQQIISEKNGQITFEYRDNQSGKLSTRSLPAVEFLWLVLQHVLPKGFRRIRGYGFLRGSARRLLQRLQLMLQQTVPQVVPRAKSVMRCPCCKQEMHCIATWHQRPAD